MKTAVQSGDRLSKMASNSAIEGADFLFDSGLDDIFASFDFGNKTVAVEKPKGMKCQHCSKICLSQQGLTRHINCK